MNFGSPEFYHRLRTEFYSKNSWEIHLLLYNEVQRVARQVARTIRDDQLRADAVDAAVNRIFTYSIHRFLKNPDFETADEHARLSWLYRAAKNAMRDSLRRANVRGSFVRRDENGEPLRIYHVSLDQTDEDGGRLLDTLSAPDGLEDRMDQRQLAIDAFRALFSLDGIAPGRIVAAACVMLSRACGVDNEKLLNSTVAKALSGHTVSESLDYVRELLATLELPEDLLRPLEARIASDDPPMSLESRNVTKAASDIRIKLLRLFSDNDYVVQLSTATERMNHHD